MIKQDTLVVFDNDTYSIGSVDAMEQFHLFRRLGPLIGSMGTELFRMLGAGTDLSTLSKTDWILMCAPLLGELAKMPQDDVNYLIVNTLKVVRKKEGDAWAPLLSPQGSMMYANLGMPAMVRLMLEMLRHNLGNFFPEAQPGAAS